MSFLRVEQVTSVGGIGRKHGRVLDQLMGRFNACLKLGESSLKTSDCFGGRAGGFYSVSDCWGSIGTGNTEISTKTARWLHGIASRFPKPADVALERRPCQSSSLTRFLHCR